MRKGRLKCAITALAVASRKARQRLLTDAQVIEIRGSAETGAELARRFGCSEANVSMVRRGKRKALVLP